MSTEDINKFFEDSDLESSLALFTAKASISRFQDSWACAKSASSFFKDALDNLATAERAFPVEYDAVRSQLESL